MCEIIKNITTGRELLSVLQNTPDYMLDQPIVVITPDGMVEFGVNCIELVDIIEEGNRVTFIRITGDEE